MKSTDVAEPVVEEMEIAVEEAPGKVKPVVKVKKRKAKVKVKGKKPVVVKTCSSFASIHLLCFPK